MSFDGADEFARAREAIERGGVLLFAAGAGMGVDSGLPDFRGPEGFWRAYPAFAKLNLRFEQIANPRWFASDPHLAWGFYGHRLELYRRTMPHPGFAALLKMGKQKRDFFVFTSNVDGHFQRAGFGAEAIVECHGSIHHLQCASPCCSDIWLNEATIVVDESTMRADDPLPQCPSCGELARPNVLMFNDDRWIPSRTETQTDRMFVWLETLKGKRLTIIECGAGTAVPTVRLQCERWASLPSSTLIRINPREPHGPPGCISLPIGAAEAIKKLAE